MMKVHPKRIGYYTTQIAGAKKENLADVFLKDGREKMSETLNVREAEELND